MNPVVIIHGWSDHASSFVDMKAKLADSLGVLPTTISYAEWLSMDDDVTYDDLVTRMDVAWTEYGLSRTPASVDVMTHSTGALLIRDWMIRNFKEPGTCPVKHLVMLAPANFGSPLAAKGSSLIGRVVKGWNSTKAFEVGAKILKGLELGSPYTWNLAQRDLFSDNQYFGPGKILATVLVGNTGYTGIAAAANEPGGDGTVRVSTANLNCARISIDLSDPSRPIVTGPQSSNAIAAFGILDGLNHGTITDPTQPGVLDAAVKAFQVTDDGFGAHCTEWTAANLALMAQKEAQSDVNYWGYQNTVFCVGDQFGFHVQDYFVEFFGPGKDSFWDDLFHREVIEDVHPYSNDNGYRAMLLDITLLKKRLAGDPPGTPLQFSLSASPDVSVPDNQVGYATFSDADIGTITIPTDGDNFSKFFDSNRTVFVDVKVARKQKPDIFQLGEDPPPQV